MSGAYSQLYVGGGSTAQATTSTAAKFAHFATVGPSANLKNGDLSIVPDLTNNKFAIRAGMKYQVSFDLSLKGDGAAVVTVQAALGSTLQANIVGSVEVITATDNEQLECSGRGIIECAADADLSLYIKSSNSINTTVVNGTFNVQRID